MPTIAPTHTIRSTAVRAQPVRAMPATAVYEPGDGDEDRRVVGPSHPPSAHRAPGVPVEQRAHPEQERDGAGVDQADQLGGRGGGVPHQPRARTPARRRRRSRGGRPAASAWRAASPSPRASRPAAAAERRRTSPVRGATGRSRGTASRSTKRRSTRRPTPSTRATSESSSTTPSGSSGRQPSASGGVDLDVELESVGPLAHPERLVGEGAGGGQVDRHPRGGRRCRRCQCTQGSAVPDRPLYSGPSTGSRRPSAVSSTHPGPTSSTGPVVTSAPRAAASCWAPRQTPSTGSPASTAAPEQRPLGGRATGGRRRRGRPSGRP